MTDDLKERPRNPMAPEVGGYRYTYPWVIDLYEEAFNYITDLEARLAAAEAGEDALAKALREIANCGQSAEPDHWKFRCMAREKARAALATYEARRKK